MFIRNSMVFFSIKQFLKLILRVTMSVATNLIYQFQKILENLGPLVEPERDAKRSISLRPYLCAIRKELRLENKAFIMIRRVALRRLIEFDYNRYTKELRKFDSAITRTQP